MSQQLYWHCATENMRLGHDDGRKIQAGQTLQVRRPLKLRNCGLHACENIMNALEFFREPNICRVTLSGNILHDKTLWVASKRTYLWHVDGRKFLPEYIRWCALQVAHLWCAPDIVIQYLKTGNQALQPEALRISTLSVDIGNRWRFGMNKELPEDSSWLEPVCNVLKKEHVAYRNGGLKAAEVAKDATADPKRIRLNLI